MSRVEIRDFRVDAYDGGAIAGNARKALEKRLKRPIVSAEFVMPVKTGIQRML